MFKHNHCNLEWFAQTLHKLVTKYVPCLVYSNLGPHVHLYNISEPPESVLELCVFFCCFFFCKIVKMLHSSFVLV